MDFSLFSTKEQKILDLRAEKIAKPLNKKNKQDDAYLQVSFDNKENYGFPFMYIDEVLETQRMANVPCTPDFIAGVINRRSEIIAVLDLNAFFGFGTVAKNEDASIIVVHTTEMQVGILTSQIIGEIRYHSSELTLPFQVSNGVKPEYIIGIHNNNVHLINLENILSSLNVIMDETF